MRLSLSLSIPTLFALVLVLHTCVAQSVISTLPYNFTLSAVNTTASDPNANTTGAPLVLGQNGRCSMLEDGILKSNRNHRCYYGSVLIRHVGELP